MLSDDYRNIKRSNEQLDTEPFIYEYQCDGVSVYSTEEIHEKEAEEYVKHARKLWKLLKNIYVEIDGEDAVLYYNVDVPKPGFERIRRITGYLVGTLDRFNDGKAAEERERVKHNVK